MSQAKEELAHVHHDEDPLSDDWEWRRRLRTKPKINHIYRVGVGIVGGLVVILGILAIPFPGPGWLIVFAGLGILATEFTWASRVLAYARGKLRAWEQWLRRQPWWMKGLVLLATAISVAVVFWVIFKVGGIPGFMPDFAKDVLHQVPGLD
jgi:uncharacterized protein (TIGR02611 family)